MLAYLAANSDRFVGTDELRTVVALDPDRVPLAAMLHSFMSHLREALRDGALPDAASDGYRLSETVKVERGRFQQLTAAADRSSIDRIWLPGQALGLARGQPFGHASWGAPTSFASTWR